MSAMTLEIEGSMDGHSGGSGEEGSSEGKAPSDFLAEVSYLTKGVYYFNLLLHLS